MRIGLPGRGDLRGTLSPRFAELPDLRHLNLKNTHVSGDIAALKNLRKLENLDLGNTKVAGDIAALGNLRELRWLHLQNTNVIGDMSALANLTSLKNHYYYCYTEGTKITCDEAALQAVLLKLGLEAKQLTDLKNSGGVTRMLSCRNT